MSRSTSLTPCRATRRTLAGAVGLAVAATGLAVAPAAQAASPSLVISEAYGGGGNSGATLKNDFIELYNPTSADVSVNGWSVQYRSAGGSGAVAVTTLTGSVPAGGYYLVQEAAGTGGTTDLPTPNATGTIAMGGTGFQVWLANTTAAQNPPADSVVSDADAIVDFLGAGSSATSYETAKAPAPSNSASVARNTSNADTDDNSVDFIAGTPTPQASDTPPPPPATTVDKTIAEIQGTGAASPFAGDTSTYVHTSGVVTAAYPAGGFFGFVIQTAGTGTGTDTTPGASDALYVFQKSGGVAATVGQHVEVTGLVSESAGLTELTYDPSDPMSSFTALTDAPEPVSTLVTSLPATVAEREAHESELLDVSAQPFTVTNNFTTNSFAEIGLATGTTPLVAPTEQVDAQDTAGIAAATAANAARAVALDDGASINFLSTANGGANMDLPLPWLSADNPVRVGSAVAFHAPVILDFRNSTWKLQPTHQVTDEGADVATFSNTRLQNAAPQDVGGDLRLATFNVLNYFNTTGVDYVAADPATHSCSYFRDRDGNLVTDNTCNPNGPRGAAENDDLVRQRDKIVAAINTLDADIVSLEEIENSVALGEADRDDALRSLVEALNAAAGTTRWAFATSPDAADLPPLEEQDVIRTAFIYNPSSVEPVGVSKVLTGSAAFGNARQPLAQAFKPLGADAGTTFGVIVNHFKSKGSGADDGTGQGNANPDRVAQAEALATFADDFKAERGIAKLFLTGDFNAYSMEDPVQKLEEHGYTNLESDTPDEYSYNFSGMDGSLDHVFANEAALADVTGVDIWDINADESVAFEYSRHNYNATNFYEPNQFRASDHDPEIVGIDVPGFPAATTSTVSATADRMVYGKAGTVEVTVDPADATGTVSVREGEKLLGSATVTDGAASVAIARKTLKPGTHTLTVTYAGDEQVQGSSTEVTVTVGKAKPTMRVTVSPRKIHHARTKPVLEVALGKVGFPVTGQVTVGSRGQVYVKKLRDGVASFTLPPYGKIGVKPVRVKYVGSDLTDGVKQRLILRIAR
jgi:predicted extracellular nuclease